jgi:hypothetical protein
LRRHAEDERDEPRLCVRVLLGDMSCKAWHVTRLTLAWFPVDCHAKQRRANQVALESLLAGQSARARGYRVSVKKHFESGIFV